MVRDYHPFLEKYDTLSRVYFFFFFRFVRFLHNPGKTHRSEVPLCILACDLLH